MRIFIVGMYKSGTTWLLSALAHHPAAVAYREFDLVRALFDVKGTERRALTSAKVRRNFLTRYPLCRMTGEQLETVEAEPSALPDVIPTRKPGSTDPRRTLGDLDREALVELSNELAVDQNPLDRATALLSRLQAVEGHSRTLILKAADQVPVMDVLDQLSPGHRKVAIVRDGRDAAVSAFYFRKLMIEQGAPWARQQAEIPVEKLFQGWLSRARMVLDAREHDDLYVLRYEDLHRDFAAELTGLLGWCGMDRDPAVVETIATATSFAKQAGRDPGEERAAVLRKGVVGDWREKLSAKEAATIWETGGPVLEAFGYGQDGSVRAFASGPGSTHGP